MKNTRTLREFSGLTTLTGVLKYADNVDPHDLDHILLADSAEVNNQLQVALAQAQERYTTKEKDNLAWNLASNDPISERNFLLARKPQEDPLLQEAVGLAAMKGKRKSMEDSHVAAVLDIKYNGQKLQIPVIAVFDGHGGASCARFMQEHLADYLKQNLPLALDMYDDNDVAIFNCLVFTCNQLNDDFKIDSSGTTANIAMVIDNHLWVANLGDTRAILCHPNENPIVLSEDARIDEQNTEEEIKSRGGRVIAGRVEGQIQVASALGDKGIIGISHRPKISKYPLSQQSLKDFRLVIACDGLWDVASSSQVARDVIRLRDKTPKQIANYLVHKAYKAGSQDNISVYVMDLFKLPPFLSKRKRRVI